MANLLVVDDSAVDRRLVAGLLQQDANLKIQTASNGVEALACMAKSLPDLVLTDMQMPEMDGLELVTATRVQYGEVPVILMTAHGSESIAVQALERGAASYVPKTHLADKLHETVTQVLALAHADQTYDRLICCLTSSEFAFALENDATLIDPLVDLVQQIVGGMGLCDATGRLRVGMALEQALLNSLYHGNLELSAEQIQEVSESLVQGKGPDLIAQRRQQAPYCERKVTVHVDIKPQRAHFVIRDEGPGFDVASLPSSNDPQAMREMSGRGLVLMRTFMDEVSFNDAGNEVTMVKGRENGRRSGG